MLNNMCKTCKRLNNGCKGTEEQVWTGCVKYTRFSPSLEINKTNAKTDYEQAKEDYLNNPTPTAWNILCDKKRVCRLLGVII